MTEKNEVSPAVNGAEEKKPVSDKVAEEKVAKVDVKKLVFADIFITENDTFEIKLPYYRKGEALLVEAVDEEYAASMGDITPTEISVTLKYPSQGDATTIINFATLSGVKKPEEVSLLDFTKLELARFTCLIRKWSLGKEITQENVMALHPKIIKGMLIKIREKILFEGIF